MRLYIKGDYTKTDFYDEFKEIAKRCGLKNEKEFLSIFPMLGMNIYI